MIADPSGGSSQFSDQQIQDNFDQVGREDVRYEELQIAPSYVNTSSTNNQASVIYADVYSRFSYWEDDIVIQGTNIPTNAPWKVLTPVVSENLVGHWQFETNVFMTGTVPGQYGPIFATGKVFDPFGVSADLLTFWAATLASSYDFSTGGQSFHRSQMMQGKLKMAEYYCRQAKPMKARMTRSDTNVSFGTAHSVKLLDDSELMRR
jgi:hypothetical protein